MQLIVSTGSVHTSVQAQFGSVRFTPKTHSLFCANRCAHEAYLAVGLQERGRKASGHYANCFEDFGMHVDSVTCCFSLFSPFVEVGGAIAVFHTQHQQ